MSTEEKTEPTHPKLVKLPSSLLAEVRAGVDLVPPPPPTDDDGEIPPPPEEEEVPLSLVRYAQEQTSLEENARLARLLQESAEGKSSSSSSSSPPRGTGDEAPKGTMDRSQLLSDIRAPVHRLTLNEVRRPADDDRPPRAVLEAQLRSNIVNRKWVLQSPKDEPITE